MVKSTPVSLGWNPLPHLPRARSSVQRAHRFDPLTESLAARPFLLNLPPLGIGVEFHQNLPSLRIPPEAKAAGEEITLRGDSDFTLTGELDRWDSQGIKFLFGMDAHPKVVRLAEVLPEGAWKPLERLPRYEIATEPRAKAPRIKEASSIWPEPRP